MWLRAVHFQSVTNGITQELRKFHYIVGTLTPNLANRLRHIICKLPSEKPNTAHREATIKLTALTNRQRYTALMTDVELGDRNPSRFFQHPENFIGNSKVDDGFLGKLPR